MDVRQLGQLAALVTPSSAEMSVSIMRAIARPIALMRPVQLQQQRMAGFFNSHLARISLNVAPRPHFANKPSSDGFSWPTNFKSWDSPHSHIDFALHFR